MDAKGMQREIERLRSRISALETPPRSFLEEIFQRYIELESTAKVAELLKERGVRNQRGSLYTAAAVAQMIRNPETTVDSVLVAYAHEIFARNSKAAARRWG